MKLEELQVAEAVRTKLGARRLAEVAANLWPVDCQSCGRALDERPALGVDDMMVTGSASLHHTACRPSDWNDSGMITRPGGALLSHVAKVLPPADRTRRGTPALLLVNPGLEEIRLLPEGESWRVATVEAYCQTHGLAVAGEPIQRAASNVTAWIIGNELSTCRARPPCGAPRSATRQSSPGSWSAAG